ncbi:MAG: YfcC family protein [Lachnospiraceae bacterium]|nr:YfcC family protein [Lachnospiraceae bacterium]
MSEKENKGLDISAKSFVAAIGILLALMLATYILTLIIPAGSYDRIIVDGRETIVDGSYHETTGGIPFWKWFLSPILVLGSSQSVTLIAVIVFLLVIGGTFNALDRSGTMYYLLKKIVHFTGDNKYKLLSVVTLFFLSMGAFIGSFEECVPMVPLAVALALAMGWDEMVGVGMSLGAVACGFSTGVLNPFTTGVAQTLMGLPVFSGISLRLLTYVLIYGCLLLFLIPYAKKCEKKNQANETVVSNDKIQEYKRNEKLDRAVKFFVVTLIICFATILLSAFVSAISGYIMIIVAVFFLIAGIGSCRCAGLGGSRIASYFGHGVMSILPSVLLILMAGSIQYTMTEAGILDTILHFAVSIISEMSVYSGIICIFLFTMIVNFFISSGSAEAVLLMPLLGPMADLSGISRQLTVLAFNYGDGFSNLIYFTNPCLLIALSLVGVSYGKWIKWSAKLQLMILVACCGILLLGTVVGY